MAAILEFTIAEQASEAIDDTGICIHGCATHAPLGLAKPEADDLQRFDPEAFQKLTSSGVTIHDVEVEDFDHIGSISHLNVVNSFGHRNAKKLYKHAIAIRLDRPILIALNSPEKDTLEAVCGAFGNPYHVF